MVEDEVVEAISCIEGLTVQEKLQVFAYLFDELLKNNESDVFELEWDWIEGLLPELCENMRGYFGIGHN